MRGGDAHGVLGIFGMLTADAILASKEARALDVDVAGGRIEVHVKRGPRLAASHVADLLIAHLFIRGCPRS